MPLPLPTNDLSDGAVRLRAWRESDLECIRLAATDPEIPAGTTVPAVFTPEEGRAFIHRQWSRFENDEGISLAIADNETDVARGLIVLLRHQYDGVYGVGYWLVPDARGNGIASRAVAMITDWAIALSGVHRIEAHVEPSNVGSIKALENAGFQREGVLRSYLNLNGRIADAVVYSVVDAHSQ